MTTFSASALIIAVPEAEPLVKEWRERFDPSAAAGVPAHITILYPFMRPHTITATDLTELHKLFARHTAFEFALTELRRTPLYLAPSPAAPFKALTYALIERYPDYPPYGGRFAEVMPHLTIADVYEAQQLDEMEREFMEKHGAQLPVRAVANEVLLIDNTAGRWETRVAFRLADCRAKQT